MSRETPEQVLKSIVDGINTGNLDALMSLYEPGAAFASQPGSLAHGLTGVRESLAAFIAMKGTLDLEVTRILEAGGLAFVAGVWSAPTCLTPAAGCALQTPVDHLLATCLPLSWPRRVALWPRQCGVLTTTRASVVAKCLGLYAFQRGATIAEADPIYRRLVTS
jgi:ketosteroid isomerase-like protein